MKILSSIKEISNIRYFSNVSRGIKPFLLDELNNIYIKKNILAVLEDNNQINQYYEL